MTRSTTDWRDRMVAALYDEIGEDERRELESALASDPELAQEWEDLNVARSALSSLVARYDSDRDPFLLPATSLPDPHPSSSAPVVPLWRWAAASAAGFAAAAALFAVLLIGGLRIDRTADGILLGLGGREGASRNAVPGAVEVLTRDEFADFARTMVAVTAARFDELERRQANTQAQVAYALYDAIEQSQLRQYDDLRARIELASFRDARGRLHGTGSGDPRGNTPTGEGAEHDFDRH